MSSKDIVHLAPTLRNKAEKFILICSESGLHVKILQTWRDLDDQAKKYRCTRSLADITDKADRLIAIGRADLAGVLIRVGPQKRPEWLHHGHLTLAGPGESKHHKMILKPFDQPFSYAFDFGCFYDGGAYITDGDHADYKKAGSIAEDLGLEWLGNNSRFKESAHVQMRGLPDTFERLKHVVE